MIGPRVYHFTRNLPSSSTMTMLVEELLNPRLKLMVSSISAIASLIMEIWIHCLELLVPVA